MSDLEIYPVKPEWAKGTNCTEEQYQSMYRQSIENPEAFWAEQAKRVDWISPWNKVKDCSFKGDVHIRWFEGGKLNVAANCLDRHLATRGDKVAVIFEPNGPDEPAQSITFKQLHNKVCKFANVLKSKGVKKGDRVTIYLPMIPEAVISMLACARIGAIHSVVFGGFSSDAVAERINSCDSQYVITADEGLRGQKSIPLKKSIDDALVKCSQVKCVFVVKRTGGSIAWNNQRDVWYHEMMDSASSDCPPEVMDAEDPLFILFTSGSTGKPKGALHTTGGYLVYTSLTHHYVFDHQESDVFWCTADVGWITGHSYVVYGALANGATTLVYEGLPNYPDASRFWQVVDKHKVTTFYTAPTAIRALMREGDEPVKKASRKSLRILGSVGEPINPEAWRWYYRTIGDERCPIVDTWWQTETGGILITPLPGCTPLKPGSAMQPFFGVQPAVFDEKGAERHGSCEGLLCLKDSWPGQMRTVYGDHGRFVSTYFTMVTGMYFSGDGCKRDEDGHYWISGRVDDVINVSGHRMGTAEVESSLVGHPKVSEAAVVGFPHPIKGQGIYAFVTLKAGEELTDSVRKELIQTVRKDIGPIATPDVIHYAPSLPKTRSGKIMRRILRKIAANDTGDLGDITTLADPEVVRRLIELTPATEK